MKIRIRFVYAHSTRDTWYIYVYKYMWGEQLWYRIIAEPMIERKRERYSVWEEGK